MVRGCAVGIAVSLAASGCAGRRGSGEPGLGKAADFTASAKIGDYSLVGISVQNGTVFQREVGLRTVISF